MRTKRQTSPKIAELLRDAAQERRPALPMAYFAPRQLQPHPKAEALPLDDRAARRARLDEATRWTLSAPHHHKPVFIGDDTSSVIERLYDMIKATLRRLKK